MSQAENRRDALIAQYREIHATRAYGRSSEVYAGLIQRQLDGIPPIKSVLDFGCGQSRLVDWVAKLNDAEARRYDPAIPEFATPPTQPADLVICTDVMEHIPENDIDDLFAQIRALTSHAFFAISLVEAVETLPNGENAHCTVRPKNFWDRRLRKHFPTLRHVRSFENNALAAVTWP